MFIFDVPIPWYNLYKNLYKNYLLFIYNFPWYIIFYKIIVFPVEQYLWVPMI